MKTPRILIGKSSSLREGPILKGDRIYARLTLNGQKIVEFFILSARDIRDVISAVVQEAGDILGHTRLYVRNMSQGWSGERSIIIR